MPNFSVAAIICIVFLFGCSLSETPTEMKGLSWLEGEWTSQKPGSDMITREIWKAEGNKLVGKGLVLQNADTTFTESLKLEMVDGTLCYVANVAHNDGPVIFKLTKNEKENWTFENPMHDFPKSIQYIRTEGGFETVVSDGERKFKLNFKKE